MTVCANGGYNPIRLKAEGVQVFTIKTELHDVGLITAHPPLWVYFTGL